MSLRTTIGAAVVLIGLVAYIYKYEREPVKSDLGEKREKVFDIDSAKIKEIEIRRPDGESVQLSRGSESWRLTAPVEAPADSNEVDSLARNLASLERERVVAESGANLAEFGLAQPRIEVHFKAEGAEKPAGVLLGDKSPTGGNLYAKLPGEEKIFLIPSYLESNFDKKPWDFRDKAIFHFNRDEVEKLILRKPSGEVVLARASEDLWNVTTPSFCRADRYKASGLVSRFETAKMEEIVSESAPNLKEYGLDKPPFEVEIQLKGGKLRRLLVGKEKNGRFYARNPARPLVYLIGSSLVDDIKKEASEYRSKRLFDFATYQVGKFQIAAASGPARVFEKAKKDDEEQWKETAPKARDLERNKAEDLLYKLNGTDAEDFAADRAESLKAYGLDAPAFTLTVWSNEGKNVEDLAVGKPGGDWVYARRKGDDPVLKLKTSAWEEIEKLMSFEEKKEETKKEGGKQDDKTK